MAANGDIFVSDGHAPNAHNSARVPGLAKDGTYIKEKKADRRSEISTNRTTSPSADRSSAVYVVDRINNRIQVFDQDGNFITEWKQFGTPSSVFVDKDDTIYVGAAFRDKAGANKIVISPSCAASWSAMPRTNVEGSHLSGYVRHEQGPGVGQPIRPRGIAADAEGSIYAADVGTQNLRKYVKVHEGQIPKNGRRFSGKEHARTMG